MVLVSCSPKPYYYHIEKDSNRLLMQGRSLVNKDKKYFEAIEKLDSIQCYNDLACRMKYFYLAKAYANIDTSISYKYLEKAVMSGQLLRYIDHENFPYFVDVDYLNDLEEDFLVKKRENELFKILKKITNEDQRIRQICNDRSLKCGNEINFVDSINYKTLDSLVSIYGWPGFAKIGYFEPEKSFPIPELIILHSDKPTNYKYLDIIRKSCLRNEESWSKYQMIVSNILMRYNFKRTNI
ncbi:MAG: hypothetical protein KDC49_16065 [Saprospiraceae bacterium]|nr:hypothetical protein [Saprospiraceae bacterium]